MGRLIKLILFAVLAFWCLTVYRTCDKTVEDGVNDGLSKVEAVKDAAKDKLSLNQKDGDNEEEDDVAVYIEDEEEDEYEEGDDYLADEYNESDDAIREKGTSTAYTSDSKKSSESEDDKLLAVADDTALGHNKEVGSYEFTSKGYSGGAKKFMVVAGSFENAANAKTFVRQLNKLGYDDAEMVKFKNSAFHSVCVGRYKDRVSASELVKSLVGDNIPAYVHTKRNTRK